MGHSVPGALAPPSLFQFGSGAWHVQQSISAVRVAPRCPTPPSRARLPSFWRRRLPAPPPPPRPLRAPLAGCALRVLPPPLFPLPASPLALSLAASSQPRPSCSLQMPLAPSRFKVPGGKWGQRISGRQLRSLWIAAAAAARRPREAPARCAGLRMLEGGGPRLGHPCLLLRLPRHPQDQEPPSWSDHAETEKPESRGLLLLSLFFVVTSKEEEEKFSSPLVDVWTLFTLPPPPHPPYLGWGGGGGRYLQDSGLGFIFPLR